MRPEMEALAYELSKEITKYRDTLDGYSLFQIGRTLTVDELVEVGRRALDIVRERER